MQSMKKDLVRLPIRDVRKFYEPVVLIKALIDIYQGTGTSRLPEPVERLETEEERFKSFVNKLANACDRIKGGTTVSAVAVLQHKEGIFYVLACNQVSYTKLEEATKHLTKILTKISGASELESAERNRLKIKVLHFLVTFHAKRVKLYMKSLKVDAKACLATLEEHTYFREVLTKTANELSDLLDALDKDGKDENIYPIVYSQCARLIKRTLSAEGMSQLVNERAKEGRMRGVKSLECWSELRHHVSRLLAYEQTMEAFVAAETEWPELFRDFEVLGIPSSRADDKPLGKKSESASGIIGRMTSNPEEMLKYRDLAQELQVIQFDDRIEKQCQRSGFRPIVHAETLLLDWITANCPIPKYHFFNRIKYIGSSKPTCKLCNYYFEAHPSRVKARPTHGNLYTSWKFPDVYKAEGPGAVKQRMSIYYSMLEGIRKDAFQIMEEKGATWKKHDSNTYTVMTGRQTELTIDDLGERLRSGLSLRDANVGEGQEEVVSDDEDGGTRLD